MSIADEYPLAEEDEPNNQTPSPTEVSVTPENRGPTVQTSFWNQVSQIGFIEPAVRLGTHLLAIVLIIAVILGMRHFYFNAQVAEIELPQRAVFAASFSAEDSPSSNQENTPLTPEMPALVTVDLFSGGIPRLALLRTTIPQRPRVDVEIYVVQEGDTVFGIAEKFGLKPETILWGNRETLNDDSHNLFPGQELFVLPIDGIYHQWSAGESLQKVAEFYGVDPEAIVEYPGNKLDVYTFDLDNPSLTPGTWLIVPGGKREFVNWGPPIITRSDPAIARTYGPGYCGEVYDGAVGSGAFVWPTTERFISGYDFSPATNHNGIDIAGSLGNPVFAIDTGVVVYSGWSNFGYGNLVVLDHGNGWQSLYAHLSSIYVSCGQSIFQAASMGTVGSTGNSSGPHLHFELIFNGAKVNPWDFISP
ncbi:MAG: M23 family metallopeptidase [Anaerolineales bacterium]|nr:M23 family metallopeptidase [Anaerolineales bacterium]